MKCQTATPYLFILVSVFLISLYLNIQDLTLESLVSSPYVLLLPAIVLLSVFFGALSLLRKKTLHLPIWVLFALSCLVSSGLISLQFRELGLKIPLLFETLIVFGTNLLFHILASGFVLLSTTSLGYLVINKTESRRPILLALTCGLTMAMMVSSLLALGGILNPITVGILLLVPLYLGRKSLNHVLKPVLSSSFRIPYKSWIDVLFLSVILTMISYISIMLIKPMAMGHDGFEVYMYLTKQVADSGSLIPGFTPYPWAPFLSLPDVLFGQHSFSLFLGHIFGFLNVLLVLHLIPKIENKAVRHTFVLLLISCPFLLFHFYMDEKIDFLLTSVVLGSILLIKESILENKTKITLPGTKNAQHSAIYLCAFLLGSALSMKYTAIFYIMALLPAFLVHRKLLFAALGSAILLSGFIQFVQITVQENPFISTSDIILLGSLFAIGSSLLIYQFRRKKVSFKIRPVPILIACIIFVLPLSPWFLKNMSEHNSISLRHAIEGKKESLPLLGEDIGLITPDVEDELSLGQPKSLFIEFTEDQDEMGSELPQDELIRYRGTENQQLVWLSLPMDILFGSNQPNNTANNLGIIFLLLLLLYFFFQARKSWLKIAIVLSVLTLTLLFMISGLDSHWQGLLNIKSINFDFGSPFDINSLSKLISIPGEVLWEFLSSLNLEFLNGLSEDINWTLPVTTIIILILGLKLSMKLSSNKAFLSMFCVSSLAFWLPTGFGIIWYILPVWILTLGLAFSFLEGIANSLWQKLGIGIGVVQIVLNLATMSVSGYKEQPRNVLYPKVVLDHSLVLFPSENAHLKNLNGPYRKAYRILNRSDDKVYMINSPFSYMINSKKNDIVRDDYLNTFGEVHSDNPNRDNFYHILKHVGVRYVIYDIRTPTKLGTQSEELTKKSTQFLEYITNHQNFDLVVTDNIVQSKSEKISLPDGRTISGKYGLQGRTLSIGTFAMFELK